jgi:hypothetical protein
MRKTLICVLVAGLFAGALGLPATASRLTQAPLHTVLYFHGTLPLGEAETPDNLANFKFMQMDPNKPTAADSKSKSYGWGNTACAGNHFFPQWVGNVSGTVVGDLKVVFTSVSNPQDIDIRFFRSNSELCNNDYPQPTKQQKVTLEGGQSETTVVFKNVHFKTAGALMVQFSPTMINNTDTPGPGRLLYDSTAAMSRIEFDCIPPSGATSCAAK